MTALAMWTVYDHPTDYPDCYVARRFDVDADGARPTDEVVTAPDLATIRKVMSVLGLTFMPRDMRDDPKIVETWV